MRAQIHHLELVYPPISNQESEWLKNDPESLDWFKRSKIYFIGQRAESKFILEPEDMVLMKLSNSGKIDFGLVSGIMNHLGVLTLLNYSNIIIYLLLSLAT
ncbi:hypothetical protein APS56_07050 [Pseudalgibacter alginicilyticus]|uniref:Uncharacterized protein n=1 Tax=Pseudalgibacter alginicilyticus TaxID=1736674 RepID=A0A0P0D837_9FLAO|nr:hypothetical protein [Pseudalgibacter alginicilyticus]ALJ04892.1 hypothetical protein APS56_07050 [Pseudalgibacter alginicilyticus]